MNIEISQMLTYRRAHDSQGEAEFIARYIAPIASPISASDGTIHAYMARVGKKSANVFSAHTDSVHNRMIPDARQSIGFDPQRGEYFVSNEKQRDCLGADNAAGCYVLLRMIAARVPGLYCFFRGEERGGIGSSWIAKNRPEIFAGYSCAIAFDRRGTNSIITHMAVGRTCSDDFAQKLADALGMEHEADPTGSFTDTANLAGIIPECTNVSVGYDFEHSARECLNALYLERLTDACIAAFKNNPAMTATRAPGAFNDATDSLCGMTDDDIYSLVDTCDPDTIARILMAARDELENAFFYGSKWR